MKSHLTPLGFVLCSIACGASSIAHASEGAASPPAPEVSTRSAPGAEPLRVQLVGDDVLATQTGKYAGATMISGFVLNVISQWQLPNGASALAQGSLSAVQNGGGQLTSSVSTFASVTGGAHGHAGDSGANPNAQARGGQSIGVNGVSQVSQVAGDRNSGTNSRADRLQQQRRDADRLQQRAVGDGQQFDRLRESRHFVRQQRRERRAADTRWARHPEHRAEQRADRPVAADRRQ
ncbi:hypothetical protein QFZ98_005883 [Paraburkholderia youngii]